MVINRYDSHTLLSTFQNFDPSHERLGRRAASRARRAAAGCRAAGCRACLCSLLLARRRRRWLPACGMMRHDTARQGPLTAVLC
jgi:hypothetical protein